MEHQLFISNKFMNEMVVYFDVFTTTIKLRILWHFGQCLVILMDNKRVHWSFKITQELLHPNCFLGSASQSHVLGLSSTQCNSGLFLALPTCSCSSNLEQIARYILLMVCITGMRWKEWRQLGGRSELSPLCCTVTFRLQYRYCGITNRG